MTLLGVLVRHYHADNHHPNDYNHTLRDVTATITNFRHHIHLAIRKFQNFSPAHRFAAD